MENNEIKKINFFKKIWFSIAKTSKYEELRNEGIYQSIRYFFTLIGLLCLIIAIVATILQTRVIKEAAIYLNENLPEMTFKENTLKVESEEATILNNEKVLSYFGRNVVINTNLEEQDAINEYYKLSKNGYTTVVFLSDEMISITNKYNPENEAKEGITVNKYEQGITALSLEASKEYKKSDIIEGLKGRVSYFNYLIQYFVAYIIMLGILYIMYIVFISLALWLMTKLLKLNWGFKNSLMNTIYSSTLSSMFFVIYMLLSYFTPFRIPYIDVVSIVLIFAYIFIIVYQDKKRLINSK